MDNLNETIDYICQKLGTTAEYIIPEYAKMKIVSNSVIALACVCLIIFVFIIWKNFDNIVKKCNSDLVEGIEILLAVGGLITVILCPLFLVGAVYEMSKFIFSPTAGFIADILGK